MKAEKLYQTKIVDEYGDITEVVLWKLPQPTVDRPHGIKYRCYFGNDAGHCLVRYDNEAGKGDHKHLGNKEVPYKFVSIEKLMEDFKNDIKTEKSKN